MTKDQILNECARLAVELTTAVNDEHKTAGFTNFAPDVVTFKYSPKRWHKLDIGTSGAFLVDAETGLVYGIKAYGVVHPKVIHGPIDKLTGATLLPRRFARANTPPAV